MVLEKTGILKYMRRCILVGGGLACIQSLIWMGLTSTGIAEYAKKNCPQNDTFNNMLGYYIKEMYFTDHSICTNAGPSQSLNSFSLFIWNCVYLGLSTTWLIISFLMIFKVKWKRVSSTYGYVFVWVFFTIALSGADIALGALFGYDMQIISELATSQSENIRIQLAYMKVASGTLMTVALRGYVFWILNFSCAIYLLVCLSHVHKGLSKEGNNYDHNSMTRPPISAYDSTIEERSTKWLQGVETMDRPKVQKQLSTRNMNMYGSTNSYQGEINPSFLQSSNTINKPPMSPRVPEPKLMPWEQSTQQQPYTPSPDYSPPLPRAKRPGLKPQYSMR